jgi:hypothetical protein
MKLAQGGAVLLAVLSCAASGRMPDGAAMEATLSASAPEHEFALPSVTDPPTSIRISVVRVANPSRQGVTIVVGLRWTGPQGTVDSPVGAVGLYPSDQPATFLVPLPSDARALLARKNGSARLVIRLQSPVPSQPLAEPLQVVFGDPAWR